MQLKGLTLKGANNIHHQLIPKNFLKYLRTIE